MDYKDTLNMPNTDFEMRGNLAQKEPGILKNWQQDNYYQSLLKHHKGQKAFILHDGPPYANGNLHAGTAMNRTIKDFIIRSHAMSGYYTPFFPGWDTHGLPIENAIQKLGVDRKALSAAEFRRKCEEYAHQQIVQQMETEKRLGQIADYEHPYITLKKEFEARQIQSFATMALNGMIFQGLKPVYWSPYNETAVADSEIVYKDVKDATIYLKFPIADGKGVLGADDNFVIWTTTPWTIPSNMAVSVHPDLEYALVKTSAGNLIVLAKFVDRLLEKFNLENLGILKTFTGKEIEGATYHHVVLDKECPCLLGTHVTDEDGTGVVHTAGGHGMDDYLVCMKNGMPPICTVDERGYMNAEAGSYQGMFFEDCSKAIIHDMSEKGYLLQVENITHSYPHDDRLKKKVIFRAVKQWFCSIERVREKALDEINNHVKWHNSFGQKRMNNMIADRGDWCISRQRLWGVPIPIIYCEDNSPIMEKEVFDHIAELMNEYGSNVWFERDAKDLLPEGYTNEKSPNGKFRKETDIMDVWFDSGSSWNELIARGDSYPCDLYFEGSDQYRGWFNSSLIVSTAVNGTAPYKEVLSHGYVVDSKGEKMSKSVGNVVNPMDIINQNGADVFRLWAMSSDFKEDLKLGPSNIKQVSDQYRKIRNTFRFLLGNVNGEDFNPSTDMVAFEDLERVDQQVLVLLNDLVADVRKDVLEYNYLSANKHLMYFMVNILSSYYCDFTKDILYVSAKGDHRRRQVQSVYWNCADALVKLWAPFLAFTAEEIWTHFSHLGANSVHYEEFPEVKELVEKNLGAAVAQWLIVSQVELVEGETAVKVEKASGQKCPRCWNYDEHVDENGLCPRCHAVMEGYKLIHQN